MVMGGIGMRLVDRTAEQAGFITKGATRGLINDDFIITRYNDKRNKLIEVEWSHVIDVVGNNVSGIKLGFKTIKSNDGNGPAKIIFVYPKEPRIFFIGDAAQLGIIHQNRISTTLDFEPGNDSNIGTGWSEEIKPHIITHRKGGISTFGRLGYKFYHQLENFKKSRIGGQAIVVLGDIILEGAQPSYNKLFNDPPIATLYYAVYRR